MLNFEKNPDNEHDCIEPYLAAGIKVLSILGVILGAGSLLWVILVVSGILHSEPFYVIVGFGYPILNLFLVAALLFSTSKIVSLVSAILQKQNNLSAKIAQIDKGFSPDEDRPAYDVAEMLYRLDESAKMLKEINENVLLDDAGKKRKLELIAQEDRRRSLAEIDRLMQMREWAQAKSILDNLLAKYPEHPALTNKPAEMEEKRKRTFNEEFVQARKIITDLIAISAWDKAIKLAENFLEKHPDMSAAKELEVHVRAERQKFRDEHIRRMYSDIQKATSKKRWNDALQIARQLMDKYPDSVEAETLSGQMETLEANADIEKRQQLEEQIKDLVHRRSFKQAFDLAKFVIDAYPTSPQAEALRQKLDKLEELAKE